MGAPVLPNRAAPPRRATAPRHWAAPPRRAALRLIKKQYIWAAPPRRAALRLIKKMQKKELEFSKSSGGWQGSDPYLYDPYLCSLSV